jgi:hypothetical protein
MPVNESKRLAKEQGLNKFDGKPCSVCGGTLRYTVNSSCVPCSAVKNKKWMTDNFKVRKEYERNYKISNREKIEAWLKSESGVATIRRTTRKTIAKGKSSWVTMMGRMRKWGRIVKWDEELNDFACREAHELARMRDRTTGIKWSVDHIVPLKGKKVTGLHTWNNLQVIPLQNNRIKHAQFEV